MLLAGCGQEGPPPLPPLPEGALEAVSVEPGVPRESLARAVDALFTREGIGRTHALLVMHRGEVVAERYAEGVAADTRFIGWSMSKTVTAVLIGMLVADGRLALDQSPPIEHWQRAGDPRGEITLRQLLQMRSGLRHEEGAEPVYESSEVQMMFLEGRDDMAAWAEAQPLAHAPGAVFRYSTASTVILADIAARLMAPDGGPSDRQQALADFLDARLAVPLGLDSMVAEYDAAGTMVAGSAIWANARDWARFGDFLRSGGAARGVQVVPRGWVDFMHSESPRASDYGAQLWLNRPSGTDRDVLFADQGPATAFAALGHLGQILYVSPDQGLTIVRLGHTGAEEQDALVDALAEISELYPVR
ncbi:MAG TPA: serine hydrolase [Paracoccaceae bacterium]|nr:serine hydrolase [Paracoccaceae bacterium]